MDQDRRMTARPLTLRRKLLYSLLSCVLLLGTIEVAWRTAAGWHWTWLDCHRYHPVLGWCLREGWSGYWEWTAGACRINEQGLRDEHPAETKAAGEKRLLVLGDSITFGGRVRTEETYCHQLERLLVEMPQATPGVWRVLNAGVTGYDAAQEADWLELFGLDLQPDALAIGFCYNDIIPADRSEWAAKYAANRATQWLNEHSIAFFSFQRSVQRLGARLPLFLKKPPPGPSPDEVIARNWSNIEEAYRRIARHARERGLPVILIIFPTRDHAEGKRHDDLAQRLQAFAREEGWLVVDLLETFRADPEGRYLPEDCLHPSPLGHRCAAEVIARALASGTPDALGN
jgi:lysophospholipase L1-like esterase